MRTVLALALATRLCAADAAAEPAPPALEARVQSIQITQRIWFSDEGAARDDHNVMQVMLRGRVAGRVAGSGRVRLVEAVTDAGETLVSARSEEEPNPFDGMVSARRMSGQAQPQLDLVLELVPPTKPAKRLASLKGTVEILLASGKPQVAEIGPIKDFIGKRVTIDGVDGAEVTVLRADGRQVELEIPRAVERLLAGVTFKDAAGLDLDVRGTGMGSSTTPRAVKRSWNVPLPPEGMMALQFHREVRTVTVPFTLTDVPMPGSNPSASAPTAVIKAKEAEEPKPVEGKADF